LRNLKFLPRITGSKPFWGGRETFWGGFSHPNSGLPSWIAEKLGGAAREGREVRTIKEEKCGTRKGGFLKPFEQRIGGAANWGGQVPFVRESKRGR